jgi:hypothetical protein
MITITQNPEHLQNVTTRAKDLTLRHELGNTVNTRNNRGFAHIGKVMVEVIRRGQKHTRVRRALHHNGGRTYLVPTAKISAYYHADGRS